MPLVPWFLRAFVSALPDAGHSAAEDAEKRRAKDLEAPEREGVVTVSPRFEPGGRIVAATSGHSGADTVGEVLQVIPSETTEIYRVHWHQGHETFFVPERNVSEQNPRRRLRRASALHELERPMEVDLSPDSELGRLRRLEPSSHKFR